MDSERELGYMMGFGNRRKRALVSAMERVGDMKCFDLLRKIIHCPSFCGTECSSTLLFSYRYKLLPSMLQFTANSVS